MTRYEKGARAERRAKRELEEQGYVVTRAAGSKGGADLVAILVRQVQVKVTENPKAWTAELEELAVRVPGGPGLTRELWVWGEGSWDKHTV